MCFFPLFSSISLVSGVPAIPVTSGIFAGIYSEDTRIDIWRFRFADYEQPQVPFRTDVLLNLESQQIVLTRHTVGKGVHHTAGQVYQACNKGRLERIAKNMNVCSA